MYDTSVQPTNKRATVDAVDRRRRPHRRTTRRRHRRPASASASATCGRCATSTSTSPPGTVLGLLGHNGAGKTTAIRILTTLVRADRGRGHGGRLRRRRATRRRSARRIGVAAQQATVDGLLTARAQPRDGRPAPRPVASATARRRADELLERLDLADAADRLVEDLLRRHAPAARPRRQPGGRARRCCSSTSRPPASIPAAAATCGTMLRDLVREGTTIDPHHAVPRRGRPAGRRHRRARPRPHRRPRHARRAQGAHRRRPHRRHGRRRRPSSIGRGRRLAPLRRRARRPSTASSSSSPCRSPRRAAHGRHARPRRRRHRRRRHQPPPGHPRRRLPHPHRPPEHRRADRRRPPPRSATSHDARPSRPTVDLRRCARPPTAWRGARSGATRMVFAGRNIEHIRQIPEKLLDVTLQPLMFVLLFAYVFGGAIARRRRQLPRVPDRRHPRAVLAFGLDRARRRRSPPTSPKASSTASARCPRRDRRTCSVTTWPSSAAWCCRSSILLGAGLVVGWRTHTDVGRRRRAALLLLVLFASAMIWIGTCVGLIVRSPDAVMGVAFVGGLPADVHQQRVRARSTSMPNVPAVGRGVEPGQRAWSPRSASCSATRVAGRQARLAARPPGRGGLDLLRLAPRPSCPRHCAATAPARATDRATD